MHLFGDNKLAAVGLKACLAAVLAITVSGCGSASNNDQGVSFTNLGYFAPDEEGVCQNDVGLTAIAISINSSSSDVFGSAFGGACIGVSNNMVSQAVRTQRIRTDYFIEGAIENPPSTVQAFSVFLSPGTPIGASSSSSSSSTAAGLGSFVVAGFVAVPAEVRSWMVLNPDKIPETPFTMTITTTVIGVTTAGDQLESNPTDLFVEVVTSLPIDSGGGASSSSSSDLALEESENFEPIF